MDLFLRDAADRIGADDVLAQIDALMDWRAVSPILKRSLAQFGGVWRGPRGCNPLLLLRCLRIGQWHGVSDPKRERTLKVRQNFVIACGLDLHAPVPDEPPTARAATPGHGRDL